MEEAYSWRRPVPVEDVSDYVVYKPGQYSGIPLSGAKPITHRRLAEDWAWWGHDTPGCYRRLCAACAACKAVFYRRHPDALYCSDRCRNDTFIRRRRERDGRGGLDYLSPKRVSSAISRSPLAGPMRGPAAYAAVRRYTGRSCHRYKFFTPASKTSVVTPAPLGPVPAGASYQWLSVRPKILVARSLRY